MKWGFLALMLCVPFQAHAYVESALTLRVGYIASPPPQGRTRVSVGQNGPADYPGHGVATEQDARGQGAGGASGVGGNGVDWGDYGRGNGGNPTPAGNPEDYRLPRAEFEEMLRQQAPLRYYERIDAQYERLKDAHWKSPSFDELLRQYLQSLQNYEDAAAHTYHFATSLNTSPIRALGVKAAVDAAAAENARVADDFANTTHSEGVGAAESESYVRIVDVLTAPAGVFRTAPGTTQYDRLNSLANYRADVAERVRGFTDHQSERRMLVGASDLLADAADLQYSEGAFEAGDRSVSSAERMLDAAISIGTAIVAPELSIARSVIELATGKNVLTGEALSDWQKGLEVANILFLGTGKAFTKAAGLLEKVAEGEGKAAEVAGEWLGTVSKADEAAVGIRAEAAAPGLEKTLGARADAAAEAISREPIAFARGTSGAAITEDRIAHASRHLIKKNLLPNFSKETLERFKSFVAPILENPTRTFDYELRGEIAAKGFYRQIEGTKVVVAIYRSGPLRGKVATSFVPTPFQVTKWGLQ